MENWIHFENLSGSGNSTRQITVDENKTELPRSTTITGTTSGKASSVTKITQKAGVKTYSDPVIKIAYPKLPATAGSVTPTLTVTQTWGWNGNIIEGGTLTEGYSVSYRFSQIHTAEAPYSVNTSTGEVTAKTPLPAEESPEQSLGSEYDIVVTVTMNGKSSSRTVSVLREANNEESINLYAKVTYSVNSGNNGATQTIETDEYQLTYNSKLSKWQSVFNKTTVPEGKVVGSRCEGPDITAQILSVRTFTSGESTDKTPIEFGELNADSGWLTSGMASKDKIARTMDINSGLTNKIVFLRGNIVDSYTSLPSYTTAFELKFVQKAPKYFVAVNKSSQSYPIDMDSTGEVTFDTPIESAAASLNIFTMASIGGKTVQLACASGKNITVSQKSSFVTTSNVTNTQIGVSIGNNTSSSSREGSITYNYTEESHNLYAGQIVFNFTQEGSTTNTLSANVNGLSIRFGTPSEDIGFSNATPKVIFNFKDTANHYYKLTASTTVSSLDNQVNFSGSTNTLNIPSTETIELESLSLDLNNFNASNTDATVDPEISINVQKNSASIGRIECSLATGNDGNIYGMPDIASTRAVQFKMNEAVSLRITGSINLDLITQ